MQTWTPVDKSLALPSALALPLPTPPTLESTLQRGPPLPKIPRPMPDFEFDVLLDALKDEVVSLAKTHLDEVRDAAVQDGKQFLETSKADLKRWTRLMHQGKLSEDEFRSLVEGKKDLAEMKALKQAGLAAVEIDRFRSALVDRIVNTVGRVLL